MRVYTVHEPKDAATAEERAERTLLVREGFCWPALFFGPVWLLYRGMFLVLLGYALLGLAVAVLVARLPALAGFWLALVAAVWFALEANALRRWSLARKGWRMVGVAAGRTLEEAEHAFFVRERRPTPSAPEPRLPPRRAAPPERDPMVIGLFPEPGGRP